MKINTMADTNYCLYLALSMFSAACMPEEEARKAFCAGYVCGLFKSIDDDDPIVAMDLGSLEQVEAIASAISGSAACQARGTSLRDFCDGKGPDPRKNPYLNLSKRVRHQFGRRFTCGEVNDNDPEFVSSFYVQRCFVAGFQTVFYLAGERSDLPVGMDGRVREDSDLMKEVALAVDEMVKMFP